MAVATLTETETGVITYVVAVNAHGQITIPKHVREDLGVKPNESKVSITKDNSGVFSIQREKTALERLEEIRAEHLKRDPDFIKRAEKIAKEGNLDDRINEAVQDAAVARYERSLGKEAKNV